MKKILEVTLPRKNITDEITLKLHKREAQSTSFSKKITPLQKTPITTHTQG